MFKQLTTATLLCSVSMAALADRIWLDDDWGPTSKAKAEFYYDTPLPREHGNWGITVFYKKTDKPRFEGMLNGPTLKKGHAVGPYRYYYSDGMLQATGQRDQDDNFVGITKCFNDRGFVGCAGEYKDGKENGPQREYFSSGAVSVSYTAVDGEKEGEEKSFYEEGTLERLTHWHKGKEEGIETGYYKDGKVRYKRTYKAGKVTDSISFFPNGQQEHVEHFIGGARDGDLKKWNKDGVLTRHFHYKDGKQVGEQYDWNSDGDTVYHRTFDDKGRQTLFEHFYAGGALYSRESTTYTSAGKIEDNYHYYDRASDAGKDAKPVVRSHEHNDLAHHRRTTQEYDETGELTEEIHYLNDDRHGDYFSLYTRYLSGSPIKVVTHAHYQNGNLEGPYSEKSADGQIDIHGKYHNGHRVGAWYQHDPNQTLTVNFSSTGEKTGEEKIVDSNGFNRQITYYRNGTYHGAYIRFDSDGKLKTQGHYVNGKRNGHWRMSSDLVYAQEQLYDEGNYRMGARVGKWSTHDSDGYLRLKGEFDAKGRKTGTWYTFDANGLLTELTHYKAGEYNGKHIEYIDGKIFNQTTYKMGEVISED